MEDSIASAATIVREADVILLVNGSGNSVECGVPCGVDTCTGTMYEELCMYRGSDFTPSLAIENPELFYGYWGRIYNLAAEATPHNGIEILKKWQHRVNSKEVLSSIEGRLPSFYLYSQAIDGVVSSVFEDHSEAHGNISHWQCIKGNKCSGGVSIWTLPKGFKFTINPVSLTYKGDPTAVSTSSKVLVFETYHSEIKYGKSEASSSIEIEKSVFNEKGFPQCPHCGSRAIPNIIDLGVETCIDSSFRAMGYMTWRMSLEDTSKPLKLLILEIGCGTSVPTAREEAETLADDLIDFKIETSFIRINSNETESWPPMNIKKSIGISLPACEALKKIDDLI